MRFTNSHQLSFWKDRTTESSFGIWIAITLLCFGAFLFVFRLTPFISEAVLFWMKLASFAVTGLFGTVGVFTDFKRQDKLTDLGKLNFAVIALSVVVGVQAQTSEYIKSNIASERNRESMERLIRGDETVLSEVRRGLEPIPESISVHYSAEIYVGGWDTYFKQSVNEHFGDLSKAREDWDVHTKVLKSDPANPSIAFDEDSVFITKDIAAQIFKPDEKEDSKVITGRFEIAFLKTAPTKPTCIMDGPPEVGYSYDYERSRHIRSAREFSIPGRYLFIYDVNRGRLSEDATVVLSLNNSLEGSASVLDLSENYFVVKSAYSVVQFSSVIVEIGHRTLWFYYQARAGEALIPLLGSPCNDGNLIARLPKLH
jgi:hypothetical protein